MVGNIQQKRKIENCACSKDEECERNCKRKRIWKSPKWFDCWIDGIPDGDCPYQIKEELSIKELFNKVFED